MLIAVLRKLFKFALSWLKLSMGHFDPNLEVLSEVFCYNDNILGSQTYSFSWLIQLRINTDCWPSNNSLNIVSGSILTLFENKVYFLVLLFNCWKTVIVCIYLIKTICGSFWFKLGGTYIGFRYNDKIVLLY